METKATCICFCTFVEVYLLTYKQVKLQRLLAMVLLIDLFGYSLVYIRNLILDFQRREKRNNKIFEAKGMSSPIVWNPRKRCRVNSPYWKSSKTQDETILLNNPKAVTWEHGHFREGHVSVRHFRHFRQVSDTTLLGQCPILFFVSIFKMQKS